MTQHDSSIYLRHIHDALSRIESYTTSGKDAFMASSLQQDAVLRNLEVVGEAVKRLPEAVRALAPETPWRRIAGMRDVLIHEYFGVDLEVVWRVVEVEVPALRGTVVHLLAAVGVV